MMNKHYPNLLPKVITTQRQQLRLRQGLSAYIAILLLVVLLVQGAGLVLEMRITRQTEMAEEALRLQETISLYSTKVAENQEKLAIYSQTYYPFPELLAMLVSHKPKSITLLSLDDQDSLSQLSNSPEIASAALAGDNIIAADGTATNDTTTIDADTAETPDGELPTESVPVTDNGNGWPEQDLSGQTIVLRGYGASATDIAVYLQKLAGITTYVHELRLTGIEEKTIAGEAVLLFEAALILKGV